MNEELKAEKVGVKRRQDPVKRIMRMVEKDLTDVEDLCDVGVSLKTLGKIYSESKKPVTRKPKFEKGSEEAKEHMKKIREIKAKKASA